MDRINRLIEKARPKPSKIERLFLDNPYMEKTYDELRAMMGEGADPAVPENGTREKDLYHVALLAAYIDRKRNTIAEPVPLMDCRPENPEPEQDPEAAAQDPDPMEAFNKIYYGEVDQWPKSD